jgi:hypothetical protein
MKTALLVLACLALVAPLSIVADAGPQLPGVWFCAGSAVHEGLSCGATEACVEVGTTMPACLP